MCSTPFSQTKNEEIIALSFPFNQAKLKFIIEATCYQMDHIIGCLCSSQNNHEVRHDSHPFQKTESKLHH